MAGRRRPLRSVSIVFAGFVTLVVLSQLSAHFFSAGIPKRLLADDAAVISGIQQTSTQLAYAAAVLGVVFAVGVLLITRQKVAADVDTYRAAGLQPGSALLRLLRSHSLAPLAWVAGTAAVTAFVDLDFGLNALFPIGLAAAFAALLVGWLGLLTSLSFARKGFEGRQGGRSG